MLDADPRWAKLVFVVFSDDWGRHPSSCQHLFRRILPHAQVIWVNTVGLRTPRLTPYDIQRGFQVMLSWLKAALRKRSNSPRQAAEAPDAAVRMAEAPAPLVPLVLRPAMWPSFRRAWAVSLNQRLLSRAVGRALARHAPGKEAVLVSTLPIVPGLFRESRFRKKVYYCVDDFTQWHGIDGRAMLDLERATLEACDLMIATSSPILEARAPRVRAASLLTHGVDVEHFFRAAADPQSPLAALPRPVIGLFGVFDRRIHAGALRSAALALPQATFAVLGPMVDREPGEFRDLPNLRFFGPVPYADLPGHVAHFDLCILPYVLDETTRGINPLKLKEYLATGKPVVSTPLPEAVKLGAYLTLAEPDGFAQAVVRAVSRAAQVSGAGNAAQTAQAAPTSPASGSEPPAPDANGLAAFLKGESWDAKAERFSREILRGL